PGEPAAAEQHRDEDRHRQGDGEEGRQHEDEEPKDEVKGDVLGDDEVRELVDAIDEEEEGEDGDADGEGGGELLPDVTIEDAHRLGTLYARARGPTPVGLWASARPRPADAAMAGGRRHAARARRRPSTSPPSRRPASVHAKRPCALWRKMLW